MISSNDDIGNILATLPDREPYKAPWDWISLPVIDTAPRTMNVNCGDTLTVTQHDGRRITLTRLHQYSTYGGMLCGLPQVRDNYPEWAIRAARDVFGKSIDPALLRPRLIRLPDNDRLYEAYPPARMPWVTSIGEFESTPSRDKDAFRSSAFIVWWQEAFGLPTDEHILMQLRDLDWIVPAQDWDP